MPKFVVTPNKVEAVFHTLLGGVSLFHLHISQGIECGP